MNIATSCVVTRNYVSTEITWKKLTELITNSQQVKITVIRPTRGSMFLYVQRANNLVSCFFGNTFSLYTYVYIYACVWIYICSEQWLVVYHK
jgi:hypothetical protein